MIRFFIICFQTIKYNNAKYKWTSTCYSAGSDGPRWHDWSVSGRLGEVLLKSTLFFLGMLSFASVSVIVLVTQELIVEARESIESSEDLQCVTIWLFIGLLLHSL